VLPTILWSSLVIVVLGNLVPHYIVFSGKEHVYIAVIQELDNLVLVGISLCHPPKFWRRLLTVWFSFVVVIWSSQWIYFQRFVQIIEKLLKFGSGHFFYGI